MITSLDYLLPSLECEHCSDEPVLTSEGDSIGGAGGGGAELRQKDLGSLDVYDLGSSGLIPVCRVPMFHSPGLLTSVLLGERIQLV